MVKDWLERTKGQQRTAKTCMVSALQQNMSPDPAPLEGANRNLEINCLGDMCPLPLMKLMQLGELQAGETVKLVTDHSCTTENIREYCEKRKLTMRVEEPITGVWELYISRAPQV